MGGLAPLLTYDTFGFATELLVSVALVMAREPKRPAFAARVAGACALTLATALLCSALLGTGWLNLLRYAAVFASVVAGIGLCFELRPHEALFFGLAAYNVQHVGWRSVELAGGLASAQLGGFALTLISLPVMAGVGTVFSRTLRANRDATVNNRQLTTLVSVVILADLVLNYIPILLGDTRGGHSVLVAAYAIICCLLTLAIQSGILARSRLEREQELLQRLWEMNRSQYEFTKSSVDVINARSHDLKKQLGVLLAASREAGEGNTGLAGCADGAIREIRESIEAYDNKAKTGNPALDVLLTQKLMQAQAQGATLAYLIDGEEFGFLNEVDLYALFGNVLDNALEAVARIDDGARRVINLRAVRRADLLVVHCENYLEGGVAPGADGLPTTSKDNVSEHGFGLRSVRMVVEKHHGNLAVHAEEGVFHLQLVIPVPART